MKQVICYEYYIRFTLKNGNTKEFSTRISNEYGYDSFEKEEYVIPVNGDSICDKSKEVTKFISFSEIETKWLSRRKYFNPDCLSDKGEIVYLDAIDKIEKIMKCKVVYPSIDKLKKVLSYNEFLEVCYDELVKIKEERND